MLFGLDGVEIGLIIVFVCLFGGILSGFPVAFAIGGAGVVAFGIIAVGQRWYISPSSYRYDVPDV